jgi:hypothetical protein
MRYLYLDNFRGFSKATVPLADVNFLVGENSTGKTSLLWMLRVLSDYRSFMGEDSGLRFGELDEEVKFGHFNEMVSVHSSDKSYFRAGLVGDWPKKKSQDDPDGAYGVLVSYKEVRGLPKLSHFTCVMVDRDITINFNDWKLWYRRIPPVFTAEEMNLRLHEWVKHHSSGDMSGWEPVSPPEGIKFDELALVFLLALARINPDARQSSEGFSVSLPYTGPRLVWIAPIRSKPRRTYDDPHTGFSSEGSHAPYVIRRMLDSDSEKEKFIEFIEGVGKASGLFDTINVKPFGDDKASPFEIDAVVDGKALRLDWLGYGVSQSLPIFVELLDRGRGTSFAIQQPEVHLHPRAQAYLGDLFFEMAFHDNKSFLIETHSDFTIDRFRLNYRKKRPKKEALNLPKSQILFFERQDTHNTVTPISIGERGDLPSDQPESYRRFFVKEEIRLLSI